MTKRRCPATSKRTGEQCKRWLAPGAVVCKWHGGGSPQALAAQDQRNAADEARSDLARLGVAIETTPLDALEVMLHEAMGNVAALRMLVQGLPTHPVVILSDSVDEDFEEQPHGGALKRREFQPGTVIGGIYGPDHNGDGKPHILVSLYGEERDRLARIAKDCAGLGLDERRVKLAEAHTDRLFDAVGRALTALPAEHRDTFKVALANEIRAA